ncbi:hypothetical protein VARIO8X_60163 [Burkholderiales bacterium 8X]|nr:hypothetical protein VARIO8X_60163 [Burkholderiales bacterium 8X]
MGRSDRLTQGCRRRACRAASGAMTHGWLAADSFYSDVCNANHVPGRRKARMGRIAGCAPCSPPFPGANCATTPGATRPRWWR